MTTGFDGFELPPPTDWQKFERLCRDLWAAIWEDPNAQLNGRSGQQQGGVDVFGMRRGVGKYSGVQCKRRGNIADPGEISEQELRDEVDKAKTFCPELGGEFVLAFTGKRDAKIQAVARALNDEHIAKGLFEVIVFSWDDIQERLGDHVHVVTKHYSGFMAALRAVDDRVLPEPALPAADGPSFVGPAARTRSVVVDGDAPYLQAEHRAEVELVRTALKEGQPSVALKQGEALRARIWTSASAELRARLLVLVAHAQLELGMDSEASRLLLEAAGQAPNDAYVQAQVALGHSLAGNETAARTWATKSLAQDPTNLVAIQIAAFYDERLDEEVLATHEALVGKRAELYSILGHRAARRHDMRQARLWFDLAIETEPKQPDIRATAAQLIVDSVNSDLTSRFYTSSDTRSDLERAERLLGEAISGLTDGAARKARAGWYASRIIAKRLLNSPDAIAAADEALAACGRQDQLVRLRAALASDADDHRSVVALIESLPPPRGFDDVGLLAAAFGNLGEIKRSTELWTELLARPNLPEHVRQEAQRNHVFSLLLENRNDEAKTAVADALASAPGALSPLLLAVAVAERLGETVNHVKWLDAAVAIAAHAPPYLYLQLGDALMRAERWNDASEVYSRAVRLGSDDVYGRRRVQALYKAGRFESALTVCSQIEEANGALSFVAEMRSSIYEILGDLERAAQACREFLVVEPRHPILGLRLALVLQRQGKIAESEKALAVIDRDSITDVETASILAQMLVRVGKSRDALEVAYRARHRHLKDVEAHLRYVSIYMVARGPEELECAPRVTLDSAVQLAGPGAPGWILISASDEADVNQREYPPNHDLAKVLVGKLPGEEILVGSAGACWSIASIGTKYGFAFGRTLELFPSHFPLNGEIEQHEFPKGDSATFLGQLKERLQLGDPRRQAAVGQYASGRCTVGAVATVLRLTTLQAIAMLSNSPGGLVCSSNSVEERMTGLSLLSKIEAPLLLDSTALLTLDSLDMLRDGTLSGRPLLVAQRTLDELAAEHFRWQSMSTEGSMSIGLEGDTLVKYETAPEEAARVQSHFEQLLEWLRAHVTVEGIAADVAERHAVHDQFGDFIGDSFWDSIRIATKAGVILVSDDLWLRHLAKNTLSVNGVCTATLLMAELQAGRLDRTRFSDALAKLIASGYRALPTDAAVLESAARTDQWRPGRALSKALSTLRGPESEADSAIVVGAEFIRSIWLNVVLSQQRATLLVAVLDVLVAGRRRPDVLRRLQARLAQTLTLLPLAQEEILRIISGWDTMGIVAVVR